MSSGAGSRRHRLALFTKNRTNPAYMGARLGADRVAARLGAALTHHVPMEPDNVEEQRALLEAALADPPDAILLVPTHGTALNDILRRIEAAGIVLLCAVSRPEVVVPRAFVGSDDRALARGIADYLLDRMPAGGTVVTIEGHPNAMTTAPRAAGFRESASGRRDIRIAASRNGDFQFDAGKAAMAALLREVPQIDGVLAANDFSALGAIEAMRESGRNIPIVGVNATPEGVRAIKSGDLLASAAFDAMKMACLATEAAVRILRGEEVPAEVMLPVEIVDRANCAAWDRPYAERPLPDWDAHVRS